jgi:hypothetical protein
MARCPNIPEMNISILVRHFLFAAIFKHVTRHFLRILWYYFITQKSYISISIIYVTLHRSDETRSSLVTTFEWHLKSCVASLLTRNLLQFRSNVTCAVQRSPFQGRLLQRVMQPRRDAIQVWERTTTTFSTGKPYRPPPTAAVTTRPSLRGEHRVLQASWHSLVSSRPFCVMIRIIPGFSISIYMYL